MGECTGSHAPTVPDFQGLVREAVVHLLTNDAELLNIGASERACAHHLAKYLEAQLKIKFGSKAFMTVDIEFNRSFNSQRHVAKELPGLIDRLKDMSGRSCRVHPDIILHRRDADTENWVVIEVKVKGRGTSYARDLDKIKLEEFTKAKTENGLGYRLGAFIELGELDAKLIWFAAGKTLEEEKIP